MKRPWSAEEEAELKRLYESGTPIGDLALHFRRSEPAIRLKAQKLDVRYNSKPIVSRPPEKGRDIDTLLSDLAESYQRKLANAEGKRNVEVLIPHQGPYGVVFFGDPHVGDDGCDVEKLAYDISLVKSHPHVYGANMGDLTNNWARALGHLYGLQSTTAIDEERLMEWLIEAIDWLWVILGNHDLWGPLAARICREHDVPAFSHGATFVIRETEGGRPFIVDARHTHKGNSMYNASHGQLKRVYRGSPAHLVIGAHIHTSAMTITKNGITGRIGHAVRVGSYKRIDEYADANGYDDETISPSVMAVVDPSASEEGFVHVFHDLDQGVMFLDALRNKFNDAPALQIAA